MFVLSINDQGRERIFRATGVQIAHGSLYAQINGCISRFDMAHVLEVMQINQPADFRTLFALEPAEGQALQ